MTGNAFLFAVAAMLLWGVAPVFGKLALGKVEPVAALAIRSAFVAVVMLAVVGLTGGWAAVAGASARDVALIAMEGLFAGLLGGLAYYYALKYGETGRVVPTAAAYPLVTLALGLALMGEKLTWGKGLGALLIAVGVALVNYR